MTIAKPEEMVPCVVKRDDGDWMMVCRHPNGITSRFIGHSWRDAWDHTKLHVTNDQDHQLLHKITLQLMAAAADN